MIKCFLKIFILPFILMCCIFGYLLHIELKSSEILIESSEEIGHIKLQIRTISEIFVDLVADLNYLSRNQSLQELLNKNTVHSKTRLENDFLSFSQSKKIYDQIRFIDENGNEIIRINYNNGNISIIPSNLLHNKSDRYYFKKTIGLDNNSIYISPLDLNVENFQIEIPQKPTIRFAKPVYDNNGNKKGIVIINYLGDRLLDKIKNIATTSIGQVSLLNSSGYWFISSYSDNEWGFMFEDRKDKVYQSDFPEAWKKIKDTESGQFYTSNGLFTFSTVHPLQFTTKTTFSSDNRTLKRYGAVKTEHYKWKTISRITPEYLFRHSMVVISSYTLYFIVLCLCLILTAIYFAKNITHTNKMHLQILKSKEQAEQAKDLIRKSEEKLIDAQHIAHIGNWEFDVLNNQMTWSDVIFTIFEINKNKHQASYELILRSIHPDDKVAFNTAYSALINKLTCCDIDYRLLTKDKKIKYIHQRSKIEVDNNNVVIRTFGTIQDISQYKQAENKIVYMAQHDSLTDLANRRLFEELSKLEICRAKRTKERLALLFIDIDAFKMVNDTLGHAIGDEVLQSVARRLKDLVRESDIVSRFGGDEFVILLTSQINSKGSQKVYDSIVKSISRPFKIKNKEILIGASIGIALYPYDGESVENLMQAADKAMYHAKRSGKNTWKMASKDNSSDKSVS